MFLSSKWSHSFRKRSHGCWGHKNVSFPVDGNPKPHISFEVHVQGQWSRWNANFYGKKLEARESGATLVLQVTLQAENQLVSTAQILSILSFNIIFSLVPMFSFRPFLSRDGISQRNWQKRRISVTSFADWHLKTISIVSENMMIFNIWPTQHYHEIFNTATKTMLSMRITQTWHQVHVYAHDMDWPTAQV